MRNVRVALQRDIVIRLLRGRKNLTPSGPPLAVCAAARLSGIPGLRYRMVQENP